MDTHTIIVRRSRGSGLKVFSPEDPSESVSISDVQIRVNVKQRRGRRVNGGNSGDNKSVRCIEKPNSPNFDNKTGDGLTACEEVFRNNTPNLNYPLNNRKL